MEKRQEPPPIRFGAQKLSTTATEDFMNLATQVFSPLFSSGSLAVRHKCRFYATDGGPLSFPNRS